MHSRSLILAIQLCLSCEVLHQKKTDMLDLPKLTTLTAIKGGNTFQYLYNITLESDSHPL